MCPGNTQMLGGVWCVWVVRRDNCRNCSRVSRMTLRSHSPRLAPGILERPLLKLGVWSAWLPVLSASLARESGPFWRDRQVVVLLPLCRNARVPDLADCGAMPADPEIFDCFDFT